MGDFFFGERHLHAEGFMCEPVCDKEGVEACAYKKFVPLCKKHV